LLGGEKGVDEVELGVGRYFYWPMTQDIFVFPVFQQNYVWARGGATGDKSITFQTQEGLSVNGDFGISYSVDVKSVTKLFQRYRRGLDEITDLFLRNMVRDALNAEASRMAIEDVYGSRRQELLATVERKLRDEVAEHGIIIERLYSVGDFRLPPQVVSAINSKIEATQRAQQRENEVREARAQAAKQVAQSEGSAESLRIQAQAEADSLLIRAKAEAEANKLRAQELTPELIQYEAVVRWNGELPSMIGGMSGLPFWAPGVGDGLPAKANTTNKTK
jgi:regulator of protease activity HflC (stomatin/prohibitin superfamily)